MKEHQKMKIRAVPIILAVTLLTASCGKSAVTDNKPTDENSSTSSPKIVVEDVPPSEDVSSADTTYAGKKKNDENKSGKAVVHLACAGDNLIHDNIYAEALQDDGSYDYFKVLRTLQKAYRGYGYSHTQPGDSGKRCF